MTVIQSGNVTIDYAWQDKFDEAYGTDEEPVFIDGRRRAGREATRAVLLFANGAMRDVSPMGNGQSPPEDRQRRLKLQMRYREMKLAKAKAEFDKYKRWAKAQKNNWERRDDVVAHLKALKAICDDHRRKLEDLEQQFNTEPSNDTLSQTQMLKMQAEAMKREMEFFNEVDQIEV